ncbi:hypothetical protein BIW11_00668 [Tropilaelaps mercedesae]|uniref:Major facilitator superfamily associated domain-containing protein n=1 Tax=Tropilaelaps mercedesae TaxID=418985 RepID=A0A1V9XRL9_9ACAR|nr:hypothetical protein BIW11_00668 [Tropilaelaps mercedesae]
MKHLNVALTRRCAVLFFALQTSAYVLILSFLPLVLRFAGFSIAASALLRAGSVIAATVLTSMVLTCVRSPSRRKTVAGFALTLSLLPLGGFIYIVHPANLTTQNDAHEQVKNTSSGVFGLDGFRPTWRNWSNSDCPGAPVWPFSLQTNSTSTESSVATSETVTSRDVMLKGTTPTGVRKTEITPYIEGAPPSTEKHAALPQVGIVTNPESWPPVSGPAPSSASEPANKAVLPEPPATSPSDYGLRRPTPLQYSSRQGYPSSPLEESESMRDLLGNADVVKRTFVRRFVNGANDAVSVASAEAVHDGVIGSGNDDNTNYAISNDPGNLGQLSRQFSRQPERMLRIPRLPLTFVASPVPENSVPDARPRPPAGHNRAVDSPQYVQPNTPAHVNIDVQQKGVDNENQSNASLANITEPINEANSVWLLMRGNGTEYRNFRVFVLALAFLTLFEGLCGIVRQVCDTLYYGYLDQLDNLDKLNDHLPFVHATTGICISGLAVVAWRLRCVLPSVFGDDSVAAFSYGIIPLTFALVAFEVFPEPEKKARLKVEPVTVNRITIFSNAQAFLLAITLVLLGASLGAEQMFVVWYIVDQKADFPFVVAFLTTPTFVSALLARAAELRRASAIRGLLLIALAVTQIRFLAFGLLTHRVAAREQFCWLLPLQLIAPFGTSFVWGAVDNFVQQVSLPQDDGSLRSSLHLAYSVLGLASGTVLAGFGCDRFGFQLTFTTLSFAAGSWSMIFFALTRFLPLHHINTTNSLRYAKLLDHEEKISSNRPINNFQEVDESDGDEDVMQFDASVTGRRVTPNRKLGLH